MELTVGELIDRLITVSQKCWHAQDRIMDKNLSEKERLEAAEIAQQTNSERAKLVREIDIRLKQSVEDKRSDSWKSYG